MNLRRLKRPIVWLLVCALIVPHTQLLYAQSSHDQGLAAGRAAVPAVRGLITEPSARAAVPGYTTNPPETAYAGRPALGADAQAKLAACALTPADPTCQALRNAVNSANTPRPAIGPNDPSVVAASRIARNPSTDLGSLAAYYSGCTTSEVASPAGNRTEYCTRTSGLGTYAVSRDLNVQVDLGPSCVAGQWFASAEVRRGAPDYMRAEAQCQFRTDGMLSMRFYAAGGRGACIGPQIVDLPTDRVSATTVVTSLSPHWGGFCWSDFVVVVLPGSGCVGNECNYAFQFGNPIYSCPAGSEPGSNMYGVWDESGNLTFGPASTCYSLGPINWEDGSCFGGVARIYSPDGGSILGCAVPVAAGQVVGASGWGLNLPFRKPGVAATETDQWNDYQTILGGAGRCAFASAEQCVDGPATRDINGHPVRRECWRYERTVSCDGGIASDQCAALAARGCVASSSTCTKTDPITGLCQVSNDAYSCPVPAETVTTASNCPADVFCLGGNCFNTRSVSDPDFGRSLSMLEAAREAGVYMDTTNMVVFKGDEMRCRDRLLVNCCDSDASGRGMNNNSVFGAGSKLVYDILMNSENRQFIYQGLSALMTSAGFAGSFTSYGVTIAVGGTALPAGSTVLYSSSAVAGEGFVIAVDPWSLAIAAVIYVVLSFADCNETEARLALRTGAGLCHEVGSYCSSCIRIPLIGCVSCIEETHSKCCFNSMLARIINEQGRAQIGKRWGGARDPDCSGFTIAQLQTLDFAAMDLSEFYASLVPTAPNVGAMEARNNSLVPTCYYGQGKCQ